jgi:hypothetical protein
VSCLDQDAGPSAPAAEEVLVELFTGADPNGCDPVLFIVCIVDEDEEEEEVPLIRKNSRRYRVSGGVAIFLLQLCLLLLVCKNYP